MTKLALIDVSHIFISAWKASEDEDLSSAFNHTMKAVLRISQTRRFDHIVVCKDMGPYLARLAIFPAYKAQRERPDVHMVAQLKRVLHKIEQMGIRVWGAQGEEADDIIATAVRHAENEGWETVIFTADKDLAQLVTLNTTVTSTRNGDIWDINFCIDKWGVGPSKMGDWLALQGDSSDNIPGCPKVGPKTAAKLLKQYGDLESILAADDIQGVVGENLKEHQEQLLINAELVRLNDRCAVVWGQIFEELENTVPKMDPGKVDEVIQAEREEVDLDDLEEDDTSPSAGDMLVAGALTMQAPPPERTPPPPLPPEAMIQAPPQAELVPAPRGQVQGIELRPGLVMTGSQFKLLTNMASYFNQGGLYRKKFESEAAIFTILELGLELGIAPQQALLAFHCIEGKPCPSAQFLIARAEADPNCEWLECVSHDENHATYATKKVKGSGAKLEFTFTMKDAEKAGLLKNYPWKAHPKAMLRKQAGSMAARLWYPGACMGLYSQEEMGHLEEVAA